MQILIQYDLKWIIINITYLYYKYLFNVFSIEYMEVILEKK